MARLNKKSKGGTQRKEVTLDDVVVLNLSKLAKEDKRPLKNYMEKILVSKSAEAVLIGKK